ncbi:hypothetical protein ACQCX2_11515 [Propionibacteriaceae bacterium Y1700]|uniref:hypothetical protein n=1 Tax=Microlunatus sp. Y1700 TaxID=3418487 RepID=UPI003DA71F4C
MRFDTSVMRDAANSLSTLMSDTAAMKSWAGEIAAIELPGAESAAAEALSTRAEIVQAVEAVIGDAKGQVDTLAKNLSDTADAYDAGEAENIDAMDEVWSDLGPNSHGSLAPDVETGATISLDIDYFPSQQMQPYDSNGVPNLAMERLMDLAATVTSIPANVFDIMVLVENMAETLDAIINPDETWAANIMGEFDPVSKTGNGYAEMAKPYEAIAEHIDFVSGVLDHSWTGLSADRAFHYMGVLANWLKDDVGGAFANLCQEYQGVADALYKRAAELADEITDAQDVLESWVAQITSLLGQAMAPEDILFETVEIFGKLATKILSVANLAISLMQLVGSWLNDYQLDDPLKLEVPDINRTP